MEATRIVQKVGKPPFTFSLNKIRLSLRETQCLACLILGMTAKQIAKTLLLSPRTVESYLKQIKNKFNCVYKHQIIIKALSHGFPIYSYLAHYQNGNDSYNAGGYGDD